MNTKLTPYLLLAALLAAGSTLAAAETSKANVSVSFHESDKFTDVRSSFGGGTDKHYLKILQDHVEQVAAKHLLPGQKLAVTFTDIDLAGDFVPTNANMNDVRIIRDVYLPRVRLSFRLTDADGTVIKEGDRQLSDLNFMTNINPIGRSDPLFYDKALLSDWLKKEL